MSTNASSSSKVESPAKLIESHKDDDHPAALGVLEEDDEFEEFPVAGEHGHHPEPTKGPFMLTLTGVDWDDAQTDLAHLGGAAPGAAKSGGDKLWEDNWDDDDVEDDFSVQLRYVCHMARFNYPCSPPAHRFMCVW